MPIASSLLNKPRLMKKLRDFYTYVQKNDGKVGQKTSRIDLPIPLLQPVITADLFLRIIK